MRTNKTSSIKMNEVSMKRKQKMLEDKEIDDICRYIECKNVARPNITKQKNQKSKKSKKQMCCKSHDDKKLVTFDRLMTEWNNRKHKNARKRLKTSLKNKKSMRAKKGIQIMRKKQIHDIMFSDNYVQHIIDSSKNKC